MPTDKLVLEITTLEQDVRSATEGLSPAQWRWGPSTGEWSIAQCLDHLNKVGNAMLPEINAAITKLKVEGRQAPKKPSHLIAYNMLDQWFVRLMSPNPPFTVPVPKAFLPEGSPNPGDKLLDCFFALQGALEKCLEDADGWDALGIRVSAPALPALKLSLAACLEGTIMHQRYHWLHAKAVRANKGFPRKTG
jgi:hypothetical protein